MTDTKTKRKSRGTKNTRRATPEVKAMQKVYSALKPLSDEDRRKVLSAVEILIAPSKNNVKPTTPMEATANAE